MIKKMTVRAAVAIVFMQLLWTVAYAQSAVDWRAKWIMPGGGDSLNRACPVFRKDWAIARRVRSATLYITAHGLYEVDMNGATVGRDYFTPGFTSYHRRLQYQVYKVGGLLHRGMNRMIVTVGDGWYRGAFGPDGKRNRYGNDAGLLCQLEVHYLDGSTEVIRSDSSWQCGTGSILSSDIYNGETQDRRIGPSGWTAIRVADEPMDNLVPSIAEPVRQQQHFTPVKILTTPKGDTVLDFGQNLSGWVRVVIQGRAGDTVQLAHAETLDAQGNFYMGNLRSASATDTYILDGRKDTLEPHFTYHGFRYVKVTGHIGGWRPENFTAIAMYSDLKRTGDFACSDSLLNRLQSNIVWSERDNFFDIPTDCPQRSERFGWTGDAQVFCRTAAFNADVRLFFKKWLADLAADQGGNGGLPVVVPDFLKPDPVAVRNGVAGWGDAATIIPWTIYEVYGDTTTLAEQYLSMKAWVGFIRDQADSNHLWKASGYGDWYAPQGPTDLGFIDECYYIRSTDLLLRAAKVLQRMDDVQTYSRLLDTLKHAFLDKYICPFSDWPQTQTAYVLALQFDLLPDSLRPAAVNRLVQLIHENNDHLATGFLGTPFLLEVLSRFGRTDLAYTLLEQKTPPSWLYPISKGATTIWEKWDAIRPDGSFDTCSLNHYAYGAVGQWLYGTVAGIQAAAPGYRLIRIAPHPGGGLTWVKASYRCSYGLIESEWQIIGKRFRAEVTIPPGTKAAVTLPGIDGDRQIDVGPGHYKWETQL